MNEQCERCSGYRDPSAPHVCDESEAELTRDMKQFTRDREAEKLDHAAFFLSTQTLPENTLAWRQGYEFAIKTLRQEASAMRDTFDGKGPVNG